MNKTFTPFRIFCEVIYLLTIVVVGAVSGYYISRIGIEGLNMAGGAVHSAFHDSIMSMENQK